MLLQHRWTPQFIRNLFSLQYCKTAERSDFCQTSDPSMKCNAWSKDSATRTSFLCTPWQKQIKTWYYTKAQSYNTLVWMFIGLYDLRLAWNLLERPKGSQLRSNEVHYEGCYFGAQGGVYLSMTLFKNVSIFMSLALFSSTCCLKVLPFDVGGSGDVGAEGRYMYIFTTVPHPHGHSQLQELLGNQAYHGDISPVTDSSCGAFPDHCPL